jgi:hypothetical protein
MFEKMTQKMAEKMGRSVKTTVVQPITTEVRKTVDNKVDLYSRILRLGVLILLFIEGTKKVSDISREQTTSPNHIIINNYITKKDGED